MSESLLTPETQQIPDKMYFRIGEVSRLVGVAPHVLRFWETEFPSIMPRKSGRSHRLYRRKDVEQFLEIKRLLYEQRFTIEGARKLLRSRRRERPRPAGSQPKLFGGAEPLLEEIRQGLREIVQLLR